MSDFKPFAQAVNARFNELSKGELFVVGDNEKGNRIFEQAYLAAFPEGTNPIYKTNTHHDCNCCKNFIRNLGNLVSIENGEIKTIWDIDTTGVGPEYVVVAKAMDEFVKSFPIIDLFRSEFSNYGAEVSRAIADDGKVINWNHFYGTVSKRHQLNGQRATGATEAGHRQASDRSQDRRERRATQCCSEVGRAPTSAGSAEQQRAAGTPEADAGRNPQAPGRTGLILRVKERGPPGSLFYCPSAYTGKLLEELLAWF